MHITTISIKNTTSKFYTQNSCLGNAFLMSLF